MQLEAQHYRNTLIISRYRHNTSIALTSTPYRPAWIIEVLGRSIHPSSEQLRIHAVNIARWLWKLCRAYEVDGVHVTAHGPYLMSKSLLLHRFGLSFDSNLGMTLFLSEDRACCEIIGVVGLRKRHGASRWACAVPPHSNIPHLFLIILSPYNSLFPRFLS